MWRYNQSVALRGKWPCSWNEEAAVDRFACTDPDCLVNDRMFKLEKSIVAEFNVLIYWLVFVAGTIMLMQWAVSRTASL